MRENRILKSLVVLVRGTPGVNEILALSSNETEL
jgi:hypothetical protein